MNERVEKQRLHSLKALEDATPDCRERWAPGTIGFHELCDRSAVLANQVDELLQEHPATLVDPDLYALAATAVDALANFHQVVALQCCDATEGSRDE